MEYHQNHYHRNSSKRRRFNPMERRPSSFRGNRRNFHGNPRFGNDNWQMPERTFDNTGNEVYDNQSNIATSSHSSECVTEDIRNPLEEKARHFLDTVFNQEGIRSKLILFETMASDITTLQSSAIYSELAVNIDQNSIGEYYLKIGDEEFAKGIFPSKQVAKQELAKQTVEVLKKDCFYVVKKKEFEEVNIKNKTAVDPDSNNKSALEGSKAHQMMMKMGWSGKGLGVNEQGSQQTVADALEQNVTRQGLGNDNILSRIHKLLEEYSKSSQMTLLKFESDFTSDERASIHKIASKFGLKSKSEGKGEQRRLTVTKKLNRTDLVHNLLLTNGFENTLYKLSIPSRFQYLWEDEEQN